MKKYSMYHERVSRLGVRVLSNCGPQAGALVELLPGPGSGGKGGFALALGLEGFFSYYLYSCPRGGS